MLHLQLPKGKTCSIIMSSSVLKNATARNNNQLSRYYSTVNTIKLYSCVCKIIKLIDKMIIPHYIWVV